MIDKSGTTQGAPAGRRSVADSRPPGSPAVTDGPLTLVARESSDAVRRPTSSVVPGVSAPKTLGGWRHLRKGAVDLGALSKAGVPVPPAALIGVPLTVGLIAGMLQRGRRRRVTPNSEVGVVPA